jgi:hypothetical protein
MINHNHIRMVQAVAMAITAVVVAIVTVRDNFTWSNGATSQAGGGEEYEWGRGRKM